MLKAVIIDDEVAAQRSLEKIVERYVPNLIRVEGVSGSLKEGIQLINKIKPDIVFLDIEMPFQNGLELFDYMEVNFDVVIISAYKDYAIEAMRCGATDYLLKPVNVSEFTMCIEKIASNRKELTSRVNDNIRYDTGKLIVPNSKGCVIIPFSDIASIEADGNYSRITKANGEKLQVNKLLGGIEESLPSYYFFRCHRSSIINVNFITEINKEKCLVSLGTKNLPITEKNIKPLMDKLKEILDVGNE